ncbi:translocon-associated protein subunit gamma-like [Pseudorca crassidens]|uniref:translocon-associated protein subunit gamma-like n=1 Tax=Pseudorca crassidens TaxID=82174 RepID=UPI00352CA9EE
MTRAKALAVAMEKRGQMRGLFGDNFGHTKLRGDEILEEKPSRNQGVEVGSFRRNLAHDDSPSKVDAWDAFGRRKGFFECLSPTAIIFKQALQRPLPGSAPDSALPSRGCGSTVAPKGGSKQQSEEDLLLQDFSHDLLAKSLVHFFGSAFIVSAIPVWLHWRIWHVDLTQSAVLYSVVTLGSTYLVAFVSKTVKFVLKHKVAQKREDAVSKEVTRKLSEAGNGKMSRKEKDERVLWKKNEAAVYEATTFSIFYNNNTLFLVLVIVVSFFILKNFNPTVNYILSISASSGLIALLSSGSK